MARTSSPDQDDLADTGLPAWVYHDADFFAAEHRAFLRASPQIVCHASDIAEPGQWHKLDYLGESIIVIRGDDGAIRAFHNVCRHRGSHIVDGEAGCARVLTCPYHAWSYDRQGALTGIPHRGDYPGLDPAALGLKPVALEQWHGFLFVRLKEGLPSVAEMMAPYESDIAPYRFEELRAIGRVTLRPRELNWKVIADNYSDHLHIPVGHPGLTRLFGKSYRIEAREWVDRMEGDLRDEPSANPSERAYQRLLPDAPHLPPFARRKWLYFKLFPCVAFDIYPDQVDFMQWLPTGPTTSVIREISYALPDDRREMRAARYLNWRINRRVNAEDTVLIARVQAGMASDSFTPGPLGRSEECLRSFNARLRRFIPEARLERPPPPGWSR
ncbi:aromatic ring-hydroxylating oxygenase subunit alpha [Sphingomonas mesophila]|uniref:aromatic ring-hydroxylating oxygenase subunit alpha n=1 Tax=Sphingomonas mesophila TaxID=2303576 RepID=UPI000E586AE0|nr:aromatic ring-hydroxylating dioxygenase subunit alpha [Sphingomonas mesophila]